MTTLVNIESLYLLADISQDGVGFWLGARRARGSHSGTCMYDQWKWVDPYGRQLGIITGFTAFVPSKPDKSVKHRIHHSRVVNREPHTT